MSLPAEYGSDRIVEMLQELGIEYVALNPGASFRGIHESLVRAGSPKMILCLSENMAVAVAHGYAKATGKPMAVILHNLVGLQSGAMGIFNAWVDQVPMLILGGSGPADASVRRPWIDWVHSARSQALVVRDYVKWDDEPRSLDSVGPSLQRAHRIATAVPCGPTYVSIDVMLQEMPLPEGLDKTPLTPVTPGAPSLSISDDLVVELAEGLVRADFPLLMADFVGRTREGFDALQDLAEALAAPVVDVQARHNFPSRHWADVTSDRTEYLRKSDFVLALEMRDLYEGIGEAADHRDGAESLLAPGAMVYDLGLNQLLHSGFLDYSSYPIGAVDVVADSSLVLPPLVEAVRSRVKDVDHRRAALSAATERKRAPQHEFDPSEQAIGARDLAIAVWSEIRDTPWMLANGHLRGAARDVWDMREFNAHLGRNTGAGLGYGLGVSVGAALACSDEMLVVDLQNDGDLLYTASGFWTAAHYRVPLLVVVANNRTYGQDRFHQLEVARERGTPVSYAGVGIDIEDPAIDFVALARSQGVEGHGPITTKSQLRSAVRTAVRQVREERRPILLDVVIQRPFS